VGEYVIGAAIGREANIGALAIAGVALKLAVSGLEAVTVPGRTVPSMGVAPKP
jgi:hydrogenase maturation factor